MAVIVIIGVIVSVFTILYFSPLDAAYTYWDKCNKGTDTSIQCITSS